MTDTYQILKAYLKRHKSGWTPSYRDINMLSSGQSLALPWLEQYLNYAHHNCAFKPENSLLVCYGALIAFFELDEQYQAVTTNAAKPSLELEVLSSAYFFAVATILPNHIKKSANQNQRMSDFFKRSKLLACMPSYGRYLMQLAS